MADGDSDSNAAPELKSVKPDGTSAPSGYGERKFCRYWAGYLEREGETPFFRQNVEHKFKHECRKQWISWERKIRILDKDPSVGHQELDDGRQSREG
jgi:hypothetical protein